VSAKDLEQRWDETLLAHQEEHHAGLYFSKSPDWASECEFRWVQLNTPNEDYVFVDVRRSLAGVIFGSDYATESIEMVRRELGDGILLGQVRYVNGVMLIAPALP
jgi:hypothetical protein